MDNGRIEAIIFDLGNVLIDFDFMIAAKKVSKLSGKTLSEIFSLFFDSQLTALFEAGKIAPLDFFLEVKKLLRLELDYSGFLPIWNEIFFLTQKNHQVYDLAKILKNRYKIALLSNVNILHFDYLKNNFPVFDIFHNIITSFEVGATKPNPLIYNKALDLLKAKPQNAFYTDDRAELIEKACELGIRGYVFKGIQQLKQDLLANSIIID
jgi:putative hydrolase of the HAD superfamily